MWRLKLLFGPNGGGRGGRGRGGGRTGRGGGEGKREEESFSPIWETHRGAPLRDCEPENMRFRRQNLRFGEVLSGSKARLPAQEFTVQPQSSTEQGTRACGGVGGCGELTMRPPLHTNNGSHFKGCAPLTRRVSQSPRVVIYLEFLPC